GTVSTLRRVTPLVDRARMMAQMRLAEVLPRRWMHVQAVGAKAANLGSVLFGEEDSAVLAAAAWLHDIGYAPNLALTGFHPLDGARWLRSVGFDERVTNLVANHSCAHLEAAERGLAAELAAEFPREESAVA